MTSPDIHRAEIDRIFAKSWLYVGHESEIPEPGDFVRRPVAGRPVFMVRGVKTGNVNVVPQHLHAPRRGGVPAGFRQFQSVSSASTTRGPSTPKGSSRASRTGTPTPAR